MILSQDTAVASESPQLEALFAKDMEALLPPTEFYDPRCDKIALAVSGGADSVCLLLQVLQWLREKSGTKQTNIDSGKRVVVIVIDHQLRAESKKEADYVVALATRLGAEGVAISWEHGKKITGNLQEQARISRYNLLTEYCHANNIRVLLTAHHQDDMLETFIIRQKRKSGILGLSSSIRSFYNNILLLRPLHNIPKSYLISYLQQQNIDWCEDESNYSGKYLRNRVRRELKIRSDAQHAMLLKDLEKTNQAAGNFAKLLQVAIAESVAFSNFGTAIIDLEKFVKFTSDDLKIQLLNYVLAIIGGSSQMPRYRNLAKILLKINSGTAIAVTLHGCVLKSIFVNENGQKGCENNCGRENIFENIPTKNSLLIFREKAKIISELLPIGESSALWDYRFKCHQNFTTKFPFYAKKRLFVTKLAMCDYVSLKQQLDLSMLKSLFKSNYQEILFTLPAIKTLEKIVAIPHISYYDGEVFLSGGKIEAVFTASFTSRFTHFLNLNKGDK